MRVPGGALWESDASRRTLARDSFVCRTGVAVCGAETGAGAIVAPVEVRELGTADGSLGTDAAS